jgi:hypothetical protein
MTDEIRIYHVDDPNDAPDRRLGAYPTINPFLPTSLPQYVIPPVASSLQLAMQYYWYSAYQQGVASVQRQVEQQQQQQQQQQQHHHHQQQHHQQQQQQQQQHQHQQQQQQQLQHQNQFHHHHHHTSSTTNNTTTTLNLTPQLNCTQPPHDSPQPLSAASTAQMASSSSASSTSSSSSSSSSIHSSSPHTPTMIRSHYSVSSNEDQEQPRRLLKTTATTTTTTTTTTSSSKVAQNQEHIKKPLNPFMIFMQKQRPEIVRQGIIKESAAINQLLGQQWRKLSREEQEPYYKLAEQEKILHAQKYPGWSARDNYANQKKRKKLKLKSISLNGLDQSDKKCRARFGLSNMTSWCKPCKRKKKCIYAGRSSNSSNNNNNNNHSINQSNHHDVIQALHVSPRMISYRRDCIPNMRALNHTCV